MKFKKRYIALTLFALFSAYNGYKGWNDTEGQKRTFGINKTPVQITPGADHYNDLVAARINTEAERLEDDRELLVNTANICNSHHTPYTTPLCETFYEIRVYALAMRTLDVSLPQVVLGETVEEMQNNKKYTRSNLDAWMETYAKLADLLKEKNGTEMLVKAGIMTADETVLVRKHLNVRYTDVLQPDFSTPQQPAAASVAVAPMQTVTTPVDAAGNLTCDVTFTRNGKVTSKQANYAEVAMNNGYFTYDATHGNRGDSTGNNAFDVNNGEAEPDPTHLLNLKTTEDNGAKIYESVVNVSFGNVPHKYVYAVREYKSGKHEFFVTDITEHFGLNMTNCKKGA